MKKAILLCVFTVLCFLVSCGHEHTYGEWKVLKEASCSETGIAQRECGECGEKETRTVPALEHTYAEMITSVPTCGKAGEAKLTCLVCGYETTKEIPATGEHVYEVIPSKAPTCTETGVGDQICVICGAKSENVELPIIEHAYVETVKKAPTCTEDGLIDVMCAVCGHSETKTVPASGHVEGEWEKFKEETCTEDGENVKKCVLCQEVLERKTVKATGHKPGKWVTDPEPSCETAGYKYQECSKCGGEIKGESVPALGHSWKEANCSDPKTCTRCGATEGYASGVHDFQNGECKYCGEWAVHIDLTTRVPFNTRTYYSDESITVSSISFDSISYYSYSGYCITGTVTVTVNSVHKSDGKAYLDLNYELTDSEGISTPTSGLIYKSFSTVGATYKLEFDFYCKNVGNYKMKIIYK